MHEFQQWIIGDIGGMLLLGTIHVVLLKKVARLISKVNLKIGV